MHAPVVSKRKHDYMKYYRVARFYMKEKYGLSQMDLEVLLYLFSEKYFTVIKFKEYTRHFDWSKELLPRLKRNGWVELFKPRAKYREAVYRITLKASRAMMTFYNLLEGKEFSDSRHNPMFRGDAGYVDRAHQGIIKRINKEIREDILKSSENDNDI